MSIGPGLDVRAGCCAPTPPASRLDLPGVALASAGLLGIVWGLVRGNGQGWGSPEIVGSLAETDELDGHT